MVDLRKDKRAPASLKVKYKSASVDQFIEQFGGDVSLGGIFIKTKTPIEIGALLKLELQLNDASPVIHGVGRVCWRREPGGDPSLPAGMGIKFVKLDPSSLTTVERIVSARGQQPSRFDQSKGAEIAPASIAPPRMSAPPAASVPPVASVPPAPAPGATPSTPAKSATARSIPAPTLPSLRAPVAKPAPVPVPAPAMRRPMAGLFADRPIARESPSHGTPAARASFFPVTPGGAPAATRSSVPPQRTTQDSSQFLAAAFTGAGVTENTAEKARDVARTAAADDDLVDQLFADVAARSVAPPPSVAPRQSSIPARPAAAEDVDELFASLGEEEGLRASQAPATPSESLPAPASDSIPLSDAPNASDVESDEDEEYASDASGDSFGEADLFGSQSIRPQSLAPAPVPAVASIPPVAFQQLAAPEKSSPVVWIALALVAAGAVGGYFYYQQHEQAERARIQREAAAAAKQAKAAAAAPKPEPEPTPEPVAQAPTGDVELEVSSLPRGSEIVVDGKVIGVTPKRVTLPTGTALSVTVRNQGYATMTKTVTLAKDSEPLRFKLEELPYSLSVRSEPPAAQLAVGTRAAVAPGPIELGHLDGDVLLSISQEGFQRMTRPVRLDEFREQDGVMRAEIEVRLSPLPGQPVAAPAEPAPATVPKQTRPKSRGKKPSAESAPADPTAAAPAPTAAPAEPPPAPAPAPTP